MTHWNFVYWLHGIESFQNWRLSMLKPVKSLQIRMSWSLYLHILIFAIEFAFHRSLLLAFILLLTANYFSKGFRGDGSSIPENLMHQQENNFKLIEYKMSHIYTKFYTTNHEVEKKLFIYCLSYQDTKLYDTMLKFIIFYIIKYKMWSLAQVFSQHEGTSKCKSRKDEFHVG